MNNRKKLYWFMTFMTFVSIILFTISSVYVEKYNTFAPMIVIGCVMAFLLVLTITMYMKYVKFICPKCNKVFKPSNSAIFWGIHTPTKRLLRCPYCDIKSWCKDHFE